LKRFIPLAFWVVPFDKGSGFDLFFDAFYPLSPLGSSPWEAERFCFF